MAKYVCSVCGYVYEGDSAPEECPVCHAGADQFKEVEGELTLAAEHEFGVSGSTVKNNPNISDEDKKFLANFYKYAFVGLVLDWIKHDMKDDPNIIVADLSVAIHGSVSAALERYRNA